MADTSYGLKTRSPLDMASAETRVRQLLAEEGFGILTEIDVASTLKEKLGLDRRPYRILGACNPQLANEALENEADVGLLLPCNVVVYQDDDDGTVVAALDPGVMVDLTDNPALEGVARQARESLQRVVDRMGAEADD